MSAGCALDNILLQPAERWGHTEYSMDYHKEYLAQRTGVGQKEPGFIRAAWDWLGMDLLWHTDDGIISWPESGRTTDMGHAVYASDQSDKRSPKVCPFRTFEEVWDFDAVEEYGLPDFDEQTAVYEKSLQDARAATPDQLVTGGYYKTIVSGAIESFGWEMFLGAASNRVRIERVLDSFFRRTLFHMNAWARTTADVIIQHDDFVWTGGAFMHPEIYRTVVIPRYARLWQPLHDAGKKVLFCSDGNFTEFAPDIVDAGADGLIFEPCNDFGWMVDQFGKNVCLVGSYVDCRDMTFGYWEKVRSDIDRTLEKLKASRGAIIAVGNHLPPNIPGSMLDRYYDYLLPRLVR